ncbi:MAG: leucine-rich repeat domain-containing protein [Paludibacteraceae bacterium]|nr:leucine-rich repeat domain-containing protein [Paludibacteraceae bacterium]
MRSFLLLVMMFVTMVANAATLLTKQYIGGVYYNVYDDGHAEATYGTLQSPENYKDEIQIRSSISVNGKSYTVTAITEDAFYACAEMTAIYIPNTVKTIGATAFYSCTGLTEVEIPNGVDSIAPRAFYKCNGLKTVDLSNTTLKTFGEYAFAECYSLQNIYLPKTLKKVPDYAFYCSASYYNGCSSSYRCTKIVIPNSVTSIGNYAFANYRYLESIEFGENVQTIGDYAFYGYCSGVYNRSLKSFYLPNSLKSIGSYAFYRMAGLTSVEIPNSVTSIGTYAFSNCTALKTVELSNSIKTIPERCFNQCTSLTSVAVPASVTTIGESAFAYCTSLGSISIPNSVTSIYNSSSSSYCPFYNCSQCIVYLCNDHISKTHSAFSYVKKVVSCDNVQMPVEINYAFFYTGAEQTYNIPSTSSYKVTGNKRTEEGTQTVTVHLFDGFTWTNGTTDDLEFEFTIYPAKLRPDQTVLTGYIGQKLKDLNLPKGYKWVDDENTVLEYAGVNTFAVEYSPEGWTRDPLLIEMTVNVTKTQIVPPAKDSTEYIYDGKSHTYQIKGTEFYKITNPDDLTQTNAGTYPIGIALKDKANHIWNTGSNQDLSYPFVIQKQTVTKPEADPTEHVYTGKEITYKLKESPLYTISNNEQTNIGSYSVVVSLKDKDNYMWDNGSSNDQYYTFTINKNGVKKPEADTRMFMFTGEPITYNIPENDLYTVTGNVQTNVGTYTVTVALKDKTYYRWSDGTTSDLKFTFKIEKLKVVIPPVVNIDFTYTGAPQAYPIAPNDGFVTVIGYDSNTGKTGSDTTQTNAGTYYVVLALKDKTNSMWVKSLSDTYGNTGNQVYTFTIKQSDVTIYPAGESPEELKLETTYGKTLKDITLPSGYAWVTPSTSVGVVGEKTFPADYTPKDSKNYVKTRVYLNVNVKPQPVSEPLADETLFYYLAKPQKYTLELSDLYSIKNNVQTNVGTYDVIVSLRDKKNYAWKTSESADDLTYKFVISKSNEAVFENGYNPNEIHPKVQYGQKLGEVTLPTRFSWANPDSVATKIGDNKFVVIYTPSDPKNYNSVETEIVVDVTKRKVAYPEKDSRLFVYNGKAQTYEVGTNDLFKVSNNVQTNAGRYDVKVALVDKEHYEWMDGTTDDIYQDFIIRTKSVEMPSVDSKTFVYDGKSHSLTIPTSADYTVAGNKGTDAGRYEVSLSLIDKKNYVWENNTTADIIATFSISKVKVDIPAADNTSFSYTGEPHTYKIAASNLYTVTGNVQTKAGSYDVTVSLKDPKNYEWVDGTSNSLIYNFYIKDIMNQSTLEIVNIPNVSKRTFVYDGICHYLAIGDTEKYTVVDDSGKYVGRYATTLSLTDKSKYIWENGSSDDVTISYVITKAPVALPAKDTRTFTYNAKNQTYNIAANEAYTVSNNVKKNAGRYEVKVALNDPKNYEWEDGSSDDLTMIFKIGKKTVTVPSADATKFTYTGEPQTYTLAKSSLYKVSNNVQTNVGVYDVVVSLSDAKNYMWTDGTTNDLIYNFIIRAEQTNVIIVPIPTVTNRNFVYNGNVQTLEIPENEHYTIANNKKVDAGRYVATLTLRDPVNTVWSDGSKEDVQYVFNITKAVVDIPEIDHTRFTYTGEAQTYKVANSEYYSVSGDVQTKVGQYEVVVALNNVRNYMWSDGTVDDLSYNFVIRAAENGTKTEVAIPSVVTRKFVYNGKEQMLDIAPNENYKILDNKGVDVGRYTVTLSLVNPDKTVWENGSTEDVLLTFTIAKAQVGYPKPDATHFIYNGEKQVYSILTSPLYSVSNNEKVDAGRYEVNVALNDSKNYEWEDGSFEDLSYSFSIAKAQVNEPKADLTKFYYNGKVQTYKITESPLYTAYGTEQSKIGKYEVLVELNDPRNYLWSNGTAEDLIYNFVIRSAESEKTSIEIPTIETKNFVYDGTPKSLSIVTNAAYKVSGNSGVDAGRYMVTLSLVDTKTTIWSDGTTEDIKMTFTIAKAPINIPGANDSTFIYNGAYQTYNVGYVNGIDSLYTVTNNYQKNAGKYAVKVSLINSKNYEWVDGTIDDVVYSFVINKAQVEIPLADNSKFTYNGKKQNYTIAADSRYTVEGATQMMPGKYEVIVSLNDDRNYEWNNGTTEALLYNFIIRSEETNVEVIPIPSVLTKNFIYDGGVKYLDIPVGKGFYVLGDTAVNAGRYVTTLSLVDPIKTVWSDGSKDDIKLVFSIAKARVDMPTADATKFTYNAKNQTYYVRDSSVYTINNNVKKAAGRYNVTVALNDVKNYEWSDGTVDDLNFNFIINKARVTIPSADNSKFVYTGVEQTYKIATSSRYTIEGNRQTMPGKYEVLVSLKDVKNYEWSNGTTEALSYNFVIRAEETTVKSITIPTVLAKNFVYDGNEKYLDIPASMDYIVLGDTAVNAGRYTTVLSLVDPIGTVWSDGSTNDIKLAFTISKAQVDMPIADATKFIYNGNNQTYYVRDSLVYTVRNNIQKNSGRYNVIVALNDTKNYEWSDGSVDDLTFNYTINKAQLAIPTADNSKYIYTGNELTYKIPEDTRYTVDGNKQTMPGKYEVLVSLVDSKNYEWSNGTTDELSYNFVIRAEETTVKSVAIPSVLTKNFVYDGSVKSLNIPTSKDFSITGNRGVEVGRYIVTLSLTDPVNTVWSDGSAEDVKMVFSIARAQVVMPDANDSIFIYNGDYQTYNVEIIGDTLYSIANNYQKNAGKYAVRLSLNDAKNYEWSDGSVDDLTFNYTISKAQLEIPTADNSKYIYTGDELTYKIVADSRYIVEGNKQTMPGKYEVLVSLVDSKNYEWSNGTTETLSYSFVIRAEEIELTPVAIPSVLTKNFVYDGTSKSLAIPSSKYYTVSGNKGVDAGRYVVTLSLNDNTKTVWSDGSNDDIKMTFTIAKAQIEIPLANDSTFNYNGDYQMYRLGYDVDSLYNVSNNYQNNAGKYVVMVALKDAKNYEWTDGSVDDLSYNFIINKAKVEIPAADERKFVYSGVEQTYKIAENSNYYVEGNVHTMPGTYEVLVSLKDSKNYEWNNGTTGVLSYNFLIHSKETEALAIAIPDVKTKNFVYDGTTKSLSISSSKYYTISGNKGVDAGRYTVTLSLTDPTGAIWSDGSTSDIKMNFTIAKAQVDLPKPNDSVFVYNGDYQTYGVRIYDDTLFTLSNNYKKDAGKYAVKISLRDAKNYEWSDGTIDDLSYNFTINKSQVTMPAADNSKFIYNEKEQTYKLATSTLYTIEGNKQTMPGKYEVLVTLKDTKNYEWTNGTTEALSYNFVIKVQETELTPVAIPSLATKGFIYDGTVKSLKIVNSNYYTVSGNKGVDAGRYTVTLSLTDPTKAIWSDGSTSDIKMSFTIAKAQVDLPKPNDSVFVYNGDYQTYGVRIYGDTLFTLSNNYKKDAGKYAVKVSLVDAKNYEWSDGSVDDLNYNFTINKAQVEIPAADLNKFVYNEKPQTYKIEADSRYSVSNNVKTTVGKYAVKVSLNDSKNYEWSNATVDDLNYSFVINKAQVEIPAPDSSNFVFTADSLVYNVAKSDLYSVAGDRQINVGNHDVVISLNDAKNYEWSDGTVSDIVYSFLIVKQEVDITTVKIPVVDVTKFTYDLKEHKIDVPSSDYYIVTGDAKTESGKYVAKVSLKDKSTMVWEDGSTDDILIPFVINKAVVKIPDADSSNFEYTGSALTYEIPNSAYYRVAGNVQTLVGRHIVTVSLVDYVNYMWSDGTSNDLQYEFIIKMKEKNIQPVSIPIVENSNFIYNGLPQTIGIKESPYYTITGNTQSLAGVYTATISLKDIERTSWEDGTTADLKIPFVIAKAKVAIPTVNSSRFVYTGDTLTCSVAANANYIVSGNSNVNAGNYQLMVALIDKVNTVWDNGSSDDVFINYSIEKIVLDKPVADSSTFVYTGDTLTLDLPTNDWYVITDNNGVNAGRYVANVALVNKMNMVWSDGTTDDIQIPFFINKAKIAIPAADTTYFVYSGDTLIYSVVENENYTVKGNVQSLIGRYSVVVSLNDIANYSWSDGSSLDLVYPFIVNERDIVKKNVPLPIIDTMMMVYNGEMQTFGIAVDSNCVVEGNVRKNAGRYVATVSLVDRTTMVWNDGTTDDIIIPFTIAKAQVEIPAADTSVFEFNGKDQTYNIKENHLYSVEGNVRTNVGRYSVFVSLMDVKNYEWNDGTTDDLEYKFTIVYPTVKDTVNPDEVRVPDVTIAAGDTITLYDKQGDYVFDIVFDSLANNQGFEDVKAEIGEDGIDIVVPDNANPGNYNAIVTITDIDGTVIEKEIQIPVSYPSSFILRLMTDVLSVKNTNNEFVSYQWYKNGHKIEGATEQFYCDLDGVKGVYKVQVVNLAGDTLFIAEREFLSIVSPFSMSLSKNPVNAGEQFLVSVEGIVDANILASSALVVYDMNGTAVVNMVGLGKRNSLAIDNVGEYIVVVRVASGQIVSAHLLVK